MSQVPPPAASPPDTGTRLGFALSAYMLGVTLIITLLPFQFAWPRQWRLMVVFEPVDIVANVLLFLPLGFLYRLTMPRGQRRSALRVLGLGALVSFAIESAQLFEVARIPAVSDVITNALGAWLGALAFDRISRSAALDGRVIGWLSLELPLMGLVYLLVPLLWVNSLATGGEAVRVAMTLVIGLFGASLLGGIQRYYFGPSRLSVPQHTAAFTGIWFLAGAFPLLVSRPLELMAGALALSALSWWLGSRPLSEAAANRRFEITLLKSAAPIYAAYLVLIVFAPLVGRVGAWSVGIGFTNAASSQIEILRLLELAAALTLVGYMAAEFRGRLETEYRESVPRLLRWGVGLALVNELTRGFHEGHGASLARAAILIAASLYGGWLYHLQRAHVIRLLSVPAQNPR